MALKYCICQHPEDFDSMIECSGDGNPEPCPGNNWFHFKCLGLKWNPDSEYYCAFCKAQRQPYALPSSNDRLEPGVYVVERIIGHEVSKKRVSGDGGKRRFWVKWLNYGEEEATLEHESKHARCSQMVAEYCRANQLEPTKLPLRGGKCARRGRLDEHQNGFDVSIWVEVDQVMTQISRYTKLKAYRTSLMVCKASMPSELVDLLLHQEQASSDSLIVLLYKEHI